MDIPNMVKGLVEKYKVPTEVVNAILGNAIVLLAEMSDIKASKSPAAATKMETLVTEYGTRWILLAKPLGVDIHAMSELIAEATMAASNMALEMHNDPVEAALAKFFHGKKES